MNETQLPAHVNRQKQRRDEETPSLPKRIADQICRLTGEGNDVIIRRRKDGYKVYKVRPISV